LGGVVASRPLPHPPPYLSGSALGRVGGALGALKLRADVVDGGVERADLGRERLARGAKLLLIERVVVPATRAKPEPVLPVEDSPADLRGEENAQGPADETPNDEAAGEASTRVAGPGNNEARRAAGRTG